MARTGLVEMSQDTKIIIDTFKRALQHFKPQQGANGSRVLLRQATKAGKKLLSRQSPWECVSHAQNVCQLLLLI